MVCESCDIQGIHPIFEGNKVLRKCSITKDVNFQEMCYISYNRKVDNTSAEI